MVYTELEHPGFFSSMLGLVIAPAETPEKLLSVSSPRFGVSILFIFLLTLGIPIGVQYYYYDRFLYHPKAIVSLLLVLFSAYIIFTIIEFFLLRIFRVKISLHVVATIACYALVPYIVLIWIMYAVNYFASGDLSFLTIVLSGHAASQSTFMKVVPWMMTLGILLSWLVLYHSLKFAGELLGLSALLLTFLSIFPLYAALHISSAAVELAIPGTQHIFNLLFNDPSSLINS